MNRTYKVTITYNDGRTTEQIYAGTIEGETAYERAKRHIELSDVITTYAIRDITNEHDNKVEEIYKQFLKQGFEEDEHMELILQQDFYIWKTGATRSNIWKWFDNNYSKGLYYLLYEMEG